MTALAHTRRILPLMRAVTSTHDVKVRRTRRNYGFRSAAAGQVLAAVREMHDGVTGGFGDTASQAAFRRRVEAAGAAMAAQVPFVAEWGPDEGFIGDGRLARWQADRVGDAP